MLADGLHENVDDRFDEHERPQETGGEEGGEAEGTENSVYVWHEVWRAEVAAGAARHVGGVNSVSSDEYRHA